MAYTVDGRLYPNPGDMLRHKTMGWVGRYVQEVHINKQPKRHFAVQAEDGKRWVTLDQDWELVENGAKVQ